MTGRQLDRADLASMSPAEIEAAREAGQLDQLLGRPVNDIPDTGQLTREHLAHMSPEQIIDAQQDGRLDDLLARGTAPGRYVNKSRPYTPPRRR